MKYLDPRWFHPGAPGSEQYGFGHDWLVGLNDPEAISTAYGIASGLTYEPRSIAIFGGARPTALYKGPYGELPDELNELMANNDKFDKNAYENRLATLQHYWDLGHDADLWRQTFPHLPYPGAYDPNETPVVRQALTSEQENAINVGQDYRLDESRKGGDSGFLGIGGWVGDTLNFGAEALSSPAGLAMLAAITAGQSGLFTGGKAAVGSSVPIVEGGMTTAEIEAAIATNGGAPIVSGGYAYGTPTLGAMAGSDGGVFAPPAGADVVLGPDGWPIESAGIPGASAVASAAGSASGNAAGGTALSRILNGSSSTADWLSVLGTVGATGLGMYTANRQADQLQGLSDRYFGMGEPYRNRLAQLYADPSSFLSSPEVTVPVQQGTDIAARALSAKVGNPVFSGGALQELQNYSTNSLYSKLGQEKDRLAGFGGLTQYNAAAPGAATSAINAGSGALTTLAGGISDVLNPKQTLVDLLKAYQGNNLFATV